MFKTGLDNQDKMRVGKEIFNAGWKIRWDGIFKAALELGR